MYSKAKRNVHKVAWTLEESLFSSTIVLNEEVSSTFADSSVSDKLLPLLLRANFWFAICNCFKFCSMCDTSPIN